ncbi:hypothetical protein ACWX0P_30920 [Vibrio mediterranei]
MSSSILLNVLDIYLDTDNPRHNPLNEQPEIIECLMKGEKVKNLARHIVGNGMNPLDLVGVVKDSDNNYVVVEGNRRLCALHLLNDPGKAPKGEVSYFQKLSESSDLFPTSLNCVLFDNLDEANVWMGIRHNGEQDGIGIRNWDSKQRTRHNGRINRKDQNALALALIEYATLKDLLKSDSSERIITTAARYLGNPFVRETMCIISPRSESEVKINASWQEFDAVLKKFCDDLVENTLVNSRSRKDDWINYAKMLIEKGIAPKNKVEPHLLSECLLSKPEFASKPSSSNENPSSAGNPGSKPSGKPVSEDGNNNNDKSKDSRPQNPDYRKFIVPLDFRPGINNKILRRVFEEMRKIEIAECPLAVSQVTRAFLENLYILFHESVTGSYTQQQTHSLMDKIIKEISLDSTLSKSEKNALAALRRVQSNELNVLSPKTLGANAHGGIYPDPTQLKREFDNIAEIIKYMLKRI